MKEPIITELTPRMQKLRDKLRQEQKAKIEGVLERPPRPDPENLIIQVNIKITTQLNRAIKNFVDKYGDANVSKYCRQKVQEGLDRDEKVYQIINQKAKDKDFLKMIVCPYCKGVGKIAAIKGEMPTPPRKMTEHDKEIIEKGFL